MSEYYISETGRLMITIITGTFYVESVKEKNFYHYKMKDA